MVRRDEVVAELKALGADVALVDGPDLAKRVAAETGHAPIMLALDGVSDTSPMNLMSCLSESGVLVSYGGTSRKPMVVHPGSLIFKKQRVRGFVRASGAADRYRHGLDPSRRHLRLRPGQDAITRAAQSGGKVLFTPQR